MTKAPAKRKRVVAPPAGARPPMLIFSDLHLEEKSADTVWQVIARIPEECRARGIRHVVFLGDWFMVRHVFVVDLVLRCRDIIRSWAPDIDRFDVVPGNHDMIDEHLGRNLLEIFGDIPFARVHVEPTWTEHGLFMPWRASQATTLAYLASPAPAGCDNVLFAHLDVRGAWMNNHKQSDHGLDLDAIAGNYRRAFLGHYHRPHDPRPGWTYVGSPWQVTYAEAGQDKGFIVWDGVRAERVTWRIGRRHHKVVVDADNPQAFTLAGVEPGDKLWVECKGQMAGVMRDVVAKAVASTGLEVDRLDVDLQPVETTARLPVQAGEHVDDTARRYVEAQDVDDTFKAALLETWQRMAPR